MNIFKRFKARLRFRRAIQIADEALQKTGLRHFVIPTPNGLVVVDRRNFRRLRNKRYINRRAVYRELPNNCVYCTPYRNGEGALSQEMIKDRFEEYIEYLKLMKNIEKEG